MSYAHLVTQFVQEFSTRCPDADTATQLSAALMNAEAAFQQHFTGKGPKKQRKQRERNPDAPKKTNWQATWTSNENGCRAYEPFAAKLAELQGAAPEGTGRFAINKQLKQWAETNGQYTAWQDWARARLVEQGKPTPVEKQTVAEEATVDGSTVTAPATATVAPTVPAAKPAPKPRGKAAARQVATVSN